MREDERIVGPLATEAAITQARQRLGVAPLRALFERFVQPLAGKWLKARGTGMLCLADRGFFGYDLWDQAVATGADLLWRIKSTLRLADVERLPDGSCREHACGRRESSSTSV